MHERLTLGLGVALQVLSIFAASPAWADDADPAVDVSAEAPANVPADVSTDTSIDAPVVVSNIPVPVPTLQPDTRGFFKRLITKEPIRQVIVADAFMEMHGGPGVGYPVIHVVGRGEVVEVFKRRTDWFYVRTSRQYEGWVEREQMLAALELNGEPVNIKEPLRSDYTTRQFEGGVFFGRFGGASLLSVYGGYGFSDHLTAELTISKSLGANYDASLASIGLTHVVAPEWFASPYFGLGTGVIRTEPHATIVAPPDSTDQMGYFAAGARGYLARRFMWRLEYRRDVIFTSRDENDKVREWKLGFAFFF